MDIKSVIKSRGFTQKQVAESLGITGGSLSQSVNNKNISIKMMQRIADVIGCEVADFFRDEIECQEQPPALVCPHCGKEIYATISLAATATNEEGKTYNTKRA